MGAIPGPENRENMARLKKGDLNHGSQTMDDARGGPLRMRLPTRVPGTTLNCPFVLEVTLREALGLIGRAVSSSPWIFRGKTAGRCVFISGRGN
jgi:hypothetical protein